MPQNDFDKELIASNLLGATTLEELQEKEKILTNAKMMLIRNNPIEGNFDYHHLKKIHSFLFKETYSWAGKDRYEANITANFGKGSTLFTSYDKLPKVSALLFDALKNENYFIGQSREEFAKNASIFMNGLNLLHPFREGNGRVQRIFMEYLAKELGYILNFKDVSLEEMTLASIKGAKGDLDLMKNIFLKSLKNQ